MILQGAEKSLKNINEHRNNEKIIINERTF